MELLAYHKYLLRLSEADRDILCAAIARDALMNNNKMAWDILKETGDKSYSPETFMKAADLLIELNNKENAKDYKIDTKSN